MKVFTFTAKEFEVLARMFSNSTSVRVAFSDEIVDRMRVEGVKFKFDNGVWSPTMGEVE